MNKWFRHENETHKLLGGFELQMDHLTSAWRTDWGIVNKKKKKKKKEKKEKKREEKNQPNSGLYNSGSMSEKKKKRSEK